MASPPPRPLAALPENPKSWRFKPSYATCEWAENYRPGGFYPVNLGDTFHDGVYRVIRKLGYGSFSTVWLAVDTQGSRYVALKIMTADASSSTAELSILDHLSTQARQYPNSQHLVVFLDTFTHEGPNGVHRCMVFEPMGEAAASIAETLPGSEDRYPQRYPKWIAKRILLHTLRGLAFLHANGVVHADVQSGNMLFSIGALEVANEKELVQLDERDPSDESKIDENYIPQRVDEKIDRWAPKKLYDEEALTEYVRLSPKSLEVKLSDLGAASWAAEPPSETTTPLALRSPERILHLRPYTAAIDIWSFGCLIYEFLTGMALFDVVTWRRTQDLIDDGHLVQLYDIIGPLPDDIMTAWPGASQRFGPERQRLTTDGGKSHVHNSLEVRFKEHTSDEIDDEEAAVVCALIRRILAFDPAQRPTAHELLEDPWFSE